MIDTRVQILFTGHQYCSMTKMHEEGITKRRKVEEKVWH